MFLTFCPRCKTPFRVESHFHQAHCPKCAVDYTFDFTRNRWVRPENRITKEDPICPTPLRSKRPA